MLHAAAEGKPYACFVRPDTRIPFMAMPDSVEALLKLARAPRSRLTQTVYNIASFNPSAGEIRDLVLRSFPDAKVTTEVHEKRQGIVDTWPADVDDSAARRDWGFEPQYGLERAFAEYLIPAVKKRYGR
jgi:nucleoside-diphosphate-sugar epimerase